MRRLVLSAAALAALCACTNTPVANVPSLDDPMKAPYLAAITKTINDLKYAQANCIKLGIPDLMTCFVFYRDEIRYERFPQ